MALFKLTTTKMLLSNGKRLEAGMTAEVTYNSRTFPWCTATKSEVSRQLQMKYNVDFPEGYMNNSNFKVEKL
jgi:hypothetical protein